jgi:hypothetical protein
VRGIPGTRLRAIAWLTGLAGLCTVTVLAAETPDPGIVLTLDRTAFELRAHDARDGSPQTSGPRFPVVLGSPAHPTPRGSFPLEVVVFNPAWEPGPSAGGDAEPMPPSRHGPMGLLKIPFAAGGRVALHGGADPLLLRKRISAGCVRATDADLIHMIGWLVQHDALDLEEADGTKRGEMYLRFERPVRLEIR